MYGQVCELHILVAAGASTAFNTEIDQLVRDLGEVKPTILVAVPRIFHRIHAGLIAQMQSRPRVIRAIFERGVAASIRCKRGESLRVRDRVVLVLAGLLFVLIRRKFGGRYAVSGSATLSREVAEFVDAIGSIRAELADRARDFRSFERPRDCVLTEEPFTIENGLLTPTLKLERRDVLARFGAALEALYLGAPVLENPGLPSAKAPVTLPLAREGGAR